MIRVDFSNSPGSGWIQGSYAALAYYHANQDEIESEMAADEEEGDHLEAQFLKLKAEQQVA